MNLISFSILRRLILFWMSFFWEKFRRHPRRMSLKAIEQADLLQGKLLRVLLTRHWHVLLLLGKSQSSSLILTVPEITHKHVACSVHVQFIDWHICPVRVSYLWMYCFCFGMVWRWPTFGPQNTKVKHLEGQTTLRWEK